MLPVHAAIPGAVADLLRQAPMSDGKIAFAWSAAVGNPVDRVTRVALRDPGVLDVEVRDLLWRRELEHSRQLILERLATLLGVGVVQEIRIRVRPSTEATSG